MHASGKRPWHAGMVRYKGRCTIRMSPAPLCPPPQIEPHVSYVQPFSTCPTPPPLTLTAPPLSIPKCPPCLHSTPIPAPGIPCNLPSPTWFTPLSLHCSKLPPQPICQSLPNNLTAHPTQKTHLEPCHPLPWITLATHLLVRLCPNVVHIYQHVEVAEAACVLPPRVRSEVKGFLDPQLVDVYVKCGTQHPCQTLLAATPSTTSDASLMVPFVSLPQPFMRYP